MCVAILALLAAALIPAIAGSREAARRAACAANLHALGVGLISYATSHNHRLPPFTFSDFGGDFDV